MTSKTDRRPGDISFEDKVSLIADEVINILKELSQEDKKQFNSKYLADKLSWRENMKSILNITEEGIPGINKDLDFKELSDAVFDKLSELMPSEMSDRLSIVKDKLSDQNLVSSPREWMDSPIKTIKDYFNTVYSRKEELEGFMQQTVETLLKTENHVMNEISSQKEKFDSDRSFQNDITDSMKGLEDECQNAASVDVLKGTILNKIDNINAAVEEKRAADIEHLRATEQRLKEMEKQMTEVKNEAEEMRKRSEELEYQSMRDGLTGLFNRKAYDDKVSEILANLKRYDVPASLLVCDIDHFKKINDTYGHKVGDMVLKKLALILMEKFRVNDFVARYGGEEFVVILPHTTVSDAVKAGEITRQFLNKSSFTYKDGEITVTISMGISSFQKEDDINSVFERADGALYLAKNSGRNCIKTENDLTS